MIKKIFILLLFMFVSTSVYARKTPIDPKRAEKRAYYNTKAFFEDRKVTREEGMTLEEYKSRKRSKADQRHMKNDKKDGIYKTPEERFNLMDEDQDGFVTEAEMQKYIKELRMEDRVFY